MAPILGSIQSATTINLEILIVPAADSILSSTGLATVLIFSSDVRFELSSLVEQCSNARLQVRRYFLRAVAIQQNDRPGLSAVLRPPCAWSGLARPPARPPDRPTDRPTDRDGTATFGFKSYIVVTVTRRRVLT